MNTTLSKLYRVQDQDNLSLVITVGEAQKGTTSIYLDAEELASSDKNARIKRVLGLGSKLKDKVLYCLTIVADIRRETNKTSVTYELTGGQTPFKQSLEESTESHGDVVFYTAIFHFYG